MGAMQRRKGQAFERAMVHRLREVMPGVEIKRGLQSRGGGKEVPDVDCPVFHIECKHMKLTNPRAALRQATADAAEGKIPVAICKDNGEPEFVVLSLEDFLEFVKQWWPTQQTS